MIKALFKKYRKSKYIGYSITVTFFLVHIIWGSNDYYITGILYFYLVVMIYSTYTKIQYVEGAREDLIYFSTVNDRLYNIPSIVSPLLYVGFLAVLLLIDNNFLGSYGVYYILGYTMVSIWGSLYGKLPSASIQINKEDAIATCYDGVETYEVAIQDIQNILLSNKVIRIEIPSKRINILCRNL